MIDLFSLQSHVIDTSLFSHALHDEGVEIFEKEFAEYVGSKYACSINSATNAIFLSLLNKNSIIKVPSIIPPVVLNAIITSGNRIEFTDNIKWVGGSYVLHELADYKIIDSAQRVEKDQFKKEAKNQDLMIFSFYPTKPVGSYDGGMIVSNDKEKIDEFRTSVMNGCRNQKNSWDRSIVAPGWKMYMSSIQAFVARKSLWQLRDKNIKLNNIRDHYNNKLSLENTSLHLYRVNVKNNKQAKEELLKQGIQCGIHYKCAHQNKVYASSSSHTKDALKGGRLPNSSHEEAHSLSIPFHEKLKEKDLNYIINNIQKWLE